MVNGVSDIEPVDKGHQTVPLPPEAGDPGCPVKRKNRKDQLERLSLVKSWRYVNITMGGN